MTDQPTTQCGYLVSDVRKSLRDAIDRRDRRAAHRWAAEFVVTPAAVGSLWASYWMSWSMIQGDPVLPILLQQSWESISDAAHRLEGDWTAFRNEPAVRNLVTEITTRFLDHPIQTLIVWPTREITLFDVAAMRSPTSIIPSAADSAAVLDVWQRNEDSMELRIMAGRFISAIESGDIRMGLSVVAWTMMSDTQQGIQFPLKYAERGPATLSAKTRASPIWFWLEIGGNWLRNSGTIHQGWIIMHNAIVSAFRIHYKRWTMVDKMRIVLAWILQLRASTVKPQTIQWAASPITIGEGDVPYKEIAAELAAHPGTMICNKESRKTPSKKLKEDDQLITNNKI